MGEESLKLRDRLIHVTRFAQHGGVHYGQILILGIGLDRRLRFRHGLIRLVLQAQSLDDQHLRARTLQRPQRLNLFEGVHGLGKLLLVAVHQTQAFEEKRPVVGFRHRVLASRAFRLLHQPFQDFDGLVVVTHRASSSAC